MNPSFLAKTEEYKNQDSSLGEPLIKFEQVTKVYPPDTVALEGVDLTVHPSEFVCLVGKSGAGKTTLLKLLLAEEEPTVGRVFFEGRDIQEFKKNNKISDYRQKMGVVFQDYKLLETKTIYENVAYIMEVIGAPDEIIEKNVKEALRIVGIEHLANQFPEQISDGEKQRAAIARALIHRPRVILADEPTGNLDPYHTRDVIRLLAKINQYGTTIILATHSKEIISILGKRVVTLEDGRIIRDDKRGRFVI